MLTDQERRELMSWKLRPFELPIHAEIRYQLERGLEGAEHSVLVGPPGTGKSFAVALQLRELEQAEAERALDDPSARIRNVVRYASANALGSKAGLIDVAEHVMGPMAGGTRRRTTPTALVERCGYECKARDVTLLIIDEAHHISGDQLDQIRQIPDFTRDQLHHPLALFLIGSDALQRSLVQIGQMGQRFSSVLSMRRWVDADLSAHWHDAHPQIARMRQSMRVSQWNELAAEVFQAARGSFRRLGHLLESANALALRLDRVIDAELLRMVIAGLAGEV